MLTMAVPVLATVMVSGVLVWLTVVLGKAAALAVRVMAGVVLVLPEPAVELLELQPVMRRERAASRQTEMGVRRMVGP